MIKKESNNVARQRRHARVRNKVAGTAECPRLNVFRSNSNISVQIIDDVNAVTLVSASSLDKSLKIENGSNIEAAKIVGKSIAEKAVLVAEEESVKERKFDYFYYYGTDNRTIL